MITSALKKAFFIKNISLGHADGKLFPITYFCPSHNLFITPSIRLFPPFALSLSVYIFLFLPNIEWEHSTFLLPFSGSLIATVFINIF